MGEKIAVDVYEALPMQITDEGAFQAARLISQRLAQRGLPVEAVTQLTAGKVGAILICWAQVELGRRTEAWLGERLDSILSLPEANADA